MTRKVKTPEVQPQEIIHDAVRADASIQKASATNRLGRSSLVSENIRTSNYGIDEDVISSKKRLLGE